MRRDSWIPRRRWLTGAVAAAVAALGLMHVPMAAGQQMCGLNTLLGSQSVRISGHLCANGGLHANADFDGVERIRCGGLGDVGYYIFPPPLYTEPDSFPGSTCYGVSASTPAGVPTLELRDRGGQILQQWPMGTSPHPDLIWKLAPGNVLEIEFRSGWPFAAAAGIFPPAAGDSAVIINFNVDAPSTNWMTHLTIGAGGPPIRATLINTRFVGITSHERLHRNNWLGGMTRLKGRVQMEPVAGLGLAVKDLVSSGPVTIGSEQFPIGIYSTGGLELSSSNWTVTGSLIALGNVEFGGNGTIFALAHLERRVPPFLRGWPYFCYTPFPTDPGRGTTLTPAATLTSAATLSTVEPTTSTLFLARGNPVRITLPAAKMLATAGRPVVGFRGENQVSISIVDITGRRVAELTGRNANAQGDPSATSIESSWDGRTDSGVLAPPGLYFARVGGSPGVSARRILVVR